MIGAPLPIAVGEMRELREYSASIPTHARVGRVWRRHLWYRDTTVPSGFLVARVLPADDDSGNLPFLWREALLIPNGATVEETLGGFLGRLPDAPERAVFAVDVRDVCRALWGLRG